jgi:hypothetical protein
MAQTQHGCFIDKEGNFWTAGNNEGIVQKYTHDGSKMLLQIGTKGRRLGVPVATQHRLRVRTLDELEIFQVLLNLSICAAAA